MKRLLPFVVLTTLLVLAVAGPAAAAGMAKGARESALASMTRASAVDPVVRVDDQTGSLEWLSGRWAAPAPGHPVESSYRFLEAHRAAFGIVSPRAEFRTLAVRADDQLKGWRDVFLGQYAGGVPVLQSTLAFHYDAQSRLVAVNGDYVPTPAEAQAPELTAGQAAAKAVAAAATLPNVDDPMPLTADGVSGERPLLSEPPVTRLAYFVDAADALRIAYEVALTGTGPEAWTVVVDARTGDILSRVSRVETAGSGIDLFGKRVSLKTSKVSGVWKLVDRSQYMFRHHSKHPYTAFEGSIEIRDAQHIVDRNGEGVPKANSPVVKDTNGDNFFNHGGSDPKKNQRSAVSLARNLSTTYKVFRSRLGRNSLDGKGLSVIGNVHLGVRYENAYWHSGTKMMYFGDNATGAPPFAKALDVVAHEFGHGVTRYSVAGGGFVYMYPSGALSEAFSDIWGTTVDPNDWQVGEDLGHVERDLADPALTDLPGNMWDYMLMVAEQDGGGNHFNATVGGHFFQQLALALPAVAPAADGRFAAAKIIYRSYPYVTNRSSYRDWGFAVSQAAVDLYGEGSAEVTATRNALTRLGIVSFEFGQNDSGWCTTEAGDLMAMQWSRSAGQCYVAQKFTRPDSMAQLARVYFALLPDPGRTYIGPGQLKVYVTGVAADGGPDLQNVYDMETVYAESLAQIEGQFTPATMTADDFVTPRVVTVPQQFFIMVGFDIGSDDINTMIVLQDDGSMSPAVDQNWLVSSEIDWNTLQEYLVKETMSSYIGQSNPLNFMIRPMYWYNMGTNRPPATAPTPGKPQAVPGADAAAPTDELSAAGLPSFAPAAAD